jgi:hypothetical protein
MKVFSLSLLLFASAQTIGQTPCLSFDGINDQVNLGSTVGNGIRTVELWFNLNQTIDPNLPEFVTLIAREVAGTNEDEFSLHFVKAGLANPGTLRFVVSQSVAVYYDVHSDENNWAPGKWHHAAAVIHPTLGMMLFIDGIKQNDTESFSNATTTVTDDTYIGCWGDLNARFYKGLVEDVRISTDGLYTSNFTPSCPDAPALPSTVGLWNLNENAGTVSLDASGNGNDANIFGASWTNSFICALSTPTLEGDNAKRTLLKITDLMGRETEFVSGVPLIYIYDDGTCKRVFTVE